MRKDIRDLLCAESLRQGIVVAARVRLACPFMFEPDGILMLIKMCASIVGDGDGEPPEDETAGDDEHDHADQQRQRQSFDPAPERMPRRASFHVRRLRRFARHRPDRWALPLYLPCAHPILRIPRATPSLSSYPVYSGCPV